MDTEQNLTVETNEFIKPPDSVAEQAEFTQEKVSKTECLQKIWKDTREEWKEIDQIKRRGHEIRNNLEKRLLVINQFVKGPWSHRAKEPLERVKLEKGHLTPQSECVRDGKTLYDKYKELNLLTAQMLSEIEKLDVKGKQAKKLKTSDKAMQTVQVDTINEDVTTTTKISHTQQKVKESEATSDRSNGLLWQIQRYCYRCNCCRQEET